MLQKVALLIYKFNKNFKKNKMNTLELKGNKEPDEQKTPVEISGSQAVLDAMISEGVDTIFGYPGGAIMPIYDAWSDNPLPLHVLVWRSIIARSSAFKTPVIIYRGFCLCLADSVQKIRI
jgi:hypothetical protein